MPRAKQITSLCTGTLEYESLAGVLRVHKNGAYKFRCPRCKRAGTNDGASRTCDQMPAMPRKPTDLRSAPLASIKLTPPQIRALAGLMEAREHGPEGGWSGRGSSAMAGALDRRGLADALEPQDEGDHLEEARARGVESDTIFKAYYDRMRAAYDRPHGALEDYFKHATEWTEEDKEPQR